MDNENLAQRVAALEAGQKSLYHITGEIKQDVKNLIAANTETNNKFAVTLERIAVKSENINEKVNSIDKRLESVENAPVKDFIHYKRLVIGCIITTPLAAFLGAILFLIIKK